MVYADTSVIVALLTREPATDNVTAWFSAFSGTLAASDWLLSEFASAISIKVRTGQIDETTARAVREEFHLLASDGLRLTPVSRNIFHSAARLAEVHEHGLRAGDALHLAAALEIGAASIATLDVRMMLNARRLGLTPVEFS